MYAPLRKLSNSFKRERERETENAHTFVVEAVYAIDRGTLVVPSQEEEVLGVLDLVGEEKADGF